MGLFDIVTGVSVGCPNCGREHSDFQSKDGLCYMESLDYRLVLRFYTICDCGYWIEYQRKPAKGLSDFELIKGETKE